MTILNKLKTVVNSSTALWIIVWVLVLFNIFTFYWMNNGFSFSLIIMFLFFALAGSGVIKMITGPRVKNETAEEVVVGPADELMKEIKQICEELFDSEINRLTNPIIENIKDDFSRGLAWLWEDKDDFSERVEKYYEELLPVPAMIESLGEEIPKLLKNLNKYLDNLGLLGEEIKNNRERDFLNLEDLIDQKVEDLKNTLRNEQDIFYDYVYKLIVVQIKDHDGEIDVNEYFSVNKLGEQFSLNLSKSLEARLSVLQDAIIKELESFSGNVVGKMQNNALQLMNTFKDIVQILSRLMEEMRGEDNSVLKRLRICLSEAQRLEDEAEEIMLTLAWQDILVEKRWQDIQEKLFTVKERVNENVDEEVINYIRSVLGTEIPAFADLVRNSENVVFYKALVDAELVYQLFEGEKLSEIISNGVYSLLQFIKPLEILAKKNIRLSEEGSNKRKLVKSKLRLDEFQNKFNKVKEAVEEQNQGLISYFDETYPRAFYAYCNNPYIKQKPENLNQAAWSIFLNLFDGVHDDRAYFLVGALLVAHQLRNKYIHPFKPQPIDLNDNDEIRYMRFAVYEAIEIFLTGDFKGNRIQFADK
ncbi:MAG: hypothetical protein ABFD08_06860 [Syntrophomonas sp.]